jgi:hypothetical protein
MKNKTTQYIDNQLFIFFLACKIQKENNRLFLDVSDLPNGQTSNHQNNYFNHQNHSAGL